MSLSDKIHDIVPPKAVAPTNWIFQEDVREAVKRANERNLSIFVKYAEGEINIENTLFELGLVQLEEFGATLVEEPQAREALI